MESDTIFYYTSLSLLFLIFALKLLQSSRTKYKNLPPSPPSLPILGHLHLIKHPAHRALQKLSQEHGPIVSLKFGSQLVVIISSHSLVEECFTRNDVVLANRPRLTVGKHITRNYNTIASAPYGDHWRNIRRIGTTEVFSNHRLNTFTGIRMDEVNRLIRKLASLASRQDDFAKVELRSMLMDLTFNVVMRMVAGKRYYGEDDVSDEEEANEFKDIIPEILRYGGTTNAEDFLPVLNWINGGSFERKVKRLARRTDKFLQRLVDEKKSNRSNTMIGHLLSLQESDPENYSDEVIKGLVLTMLVAGTDTSAVTLEWAMSNLVNHPHVLGKAKAEIDSQVGENRMIVEADVPKLSYLQGIISETLRLNPPAPLLLPHMASDYCTVGGYDVPRGTILLVNAWAIHRDPVTWDDPTDFKPERFESGPGEAHKLMPFGLGRRACPGSGMAQRVVGLTLGSLIQCFDWKRIDEKLVDMSEGKGVTMPKGEPLQVMCRARGIVDKVSV